MENALNAYIGKLSERLAGMKNRTASDDSDRERQEMLECVQKAMTEWCEAERFFENVSEPELVDYAIFRIEACKKRYMYLLKKAKDMGIRVDL